MFLIHTAWVELPAVIRIRLGTVARKAPISVVVKSMAYPLGYEFVASMFAVTPTKVQMDETVVVKLIGFLVVTCVSSPLCG